MTFATLRALHTLIGAALDDIEAVYHDAATSGSNTNSVAGLPSPLSPSLSTPASTSLHAYSYSPTPSTPYSPTDCDRDSARDLYPSPSPLSPAFSVSTAPRGAFAPYTAYSPVPHSRSDSLADTLSLSLSLGQRPPSPTPSFSTLSSYSGTASSRASSRLNLGDVIDPERIQPPVSALAPMHIKSEGVSAQWTHDTPPASPAVPAPTSTPVRRLPLASSRFLRHAASELLATPSRLSQAGFCSSAAAGSPHTPKSAGAGKYAGHHSLDGAPPKAQRTPQRGVFASASVSDLLSTPQSKARPRGSMDARSVCTATSLGGDGKGSPSPIRFAPNPHPDPLADGADGAETYEYGQRLPTVLGSPATPRRASDKTPGDTLATPTSAWPGSGEGAERSADGRKQRHRPTPLLPALVPTGQGQGQLPPTPASLFSLSMSSPTSRSCLAGETDALDVDTHAAGASLDKDRRSQGPTLGAPWEEGQSAARKPWFEKGARVSGRALDWPALDEPAYVARGKDGDQAASRVSVDESPGDTDEDRARVLCETLTTHPAVLAAVSKLVAACGQLSASVQRPFLTVCDAAMGYNLPACLRLLEAAHVPEILREAGPKGLHVREIAMRVDKVRQANRARRANSNEAGSKEAGFDEEEAGVDPVLLSHVLRLLATHHITREVRPDVFANNRISGAIDSGMTQAELAKTPETKYEGTDGIAAFVGLCTDELFKSAAYLTDCYLPPLEGSDLGALSSAPQPQTAAEREVPVVNTPHNDDRDRGGKGTGNQVDLADLALGTHDSPKSPLRTKRSFLGSPVPSVESTSSNVRQRPRALSIVPTPASPSKMPALRRPRAFSIIPSSSSSGPTAALPPLPPLPSTPPKARGLQPSLTKHDASPTRPSALAGQISSQKEEKGDNPMHAPFNLAFRTNAPYFEWLERRGNGGRLKRFGRAMTGTGAWEVPGAIVGGFPWHSLPPSAVVVDVGGGIGSTSMLLAYAFPHLRFLVQDRAPVVEMGESMRSMFNSQERTLRELSTLAQTAGWRIVQVVRSESSLFGHITAVPVEIPAESLALLDNPLPGTEGASTGSGAPGKIKRPAMGDTFCSFVDLPSDDTVRKGVRASKRAAGAQGWQARASEWKQRLVKKGSAIFKDRKGQSHALPPSPAPPPLPATPTELLPPSDVADHEKEQKGKRSLGTPKSGGGPRGLRKVLSRAQLSAGGVERQRERVERTATVPSG
ncbi:hypothetical protein IEO21_05905 [Rhodonia placenta]|uniref:O-methyltransferase domain-containing protein n=1 Tax=Rhodonia placenta TaxID=104341 RepID=A0A8H7P142_9APHY|nr:hypothetical protein IEO21_05905 [Postia placenta]